MDVGNLAFDFVERCTTHRTASDVLSDLLDTVRQFGFEHLIFSGVPTGTQKLAPMVELNGWPPGWLDRYVAEEHATRDGVCLHSARARNPFFWHDLPPDVGDTDGSKRVAGEATEFGIFSGYAVPMHSERHWHSVMSFASPFQKIDISAREIHALQFMAIFAGGQVESFLGPVEAPHLSNREQEVLAWTAAGKTAWEISKILGISLDTVKFHLKNVRMKFGAPNNIQAVVEGIRVRAFNP